MPMTGIHSQIIGPSQPKDQVTREPGSNPDDPLDVVVPAPNQIEEGTEIHQFEFKPNGGNGVTLSLALTIKPGHGGVNSATPDDLASARGHTKRGIREMAGQDGKPQYGGYKNRVAEAFLADLELFLDRNKDWGEISLLYAGKNDHRLIARIKQGEGFRIDSLERIAETMNLAERGEISPESYRNTRQRRASGEGGEPSSDQSAPDDRQSNKSDD